MRSFVIVAALAAVAAAPKPVFPAGVGQQQVQAGCSGCHAPAIITGQHYTAKKWEQLVDQMVDRGAKVSDADFDVVVAYLAKNFGPKK